MSGSIERLESLLGRLPGIGPRQARRFVYFLLGDKTGLAGEIASLLSRLGEDVSQCPNCRRFFPRVEGSKPCGICLNVDGLRDQALLMIVEKDVDLESVERAGVFRGSYFVLGGLLPILEKNPPSKIRLSDLDRLLNQKVKLHGQANENLSNTKTDSAPVERNPAPRTASPVSDLRSSGARIKKDKLEIVLALSANLEGDHTAEFLEEYLRNKFGEKITVSFLGRGLSTGTELEYSDRDTLLYALKNRGSR